MLRRVVAAGAVTIVTLFGLARRVRRQTEKVPLSYEPAVSGHGSQAPEEQLPGVWQPFTCSPSLQPQSKSPGL